MIRELSAFIVFFLLISVLIPINTHEESPISRSESIADTPGIMRLTWFGNATNPVIRYSGENYDVVWQDDRDGNWDIFYLRITPWGFKLVNDSRITSYDGEDTNPDMVSRVSHIFIVWQRYVNGHWAIYFSRLLYSNENISIEVPPKPVRSVNRNATNPRMAMDSDGFLHVVWQEFVNGNWDIMYDKLDQNGNPVFSPIDVSLDRTNSTEPRVVVGKNNTVGVLWLDDNITPGMSVFYRELDCCGYFKSPPRRISVVSPGTEISATYSGYVDVAFSCKRENRSYEIIYTKLNESGITLIDDRNLTALDGINSTDPEIVKYNTHLLVVWNDAASKIKMGIFDENASIRDLITISSENSTEPFIAVSSDNAGIVWIEKTGGRNSLFYREIKFGNVRIEGIDVERAEEGYNITAVISTTNHPIETDFELRVDGSVVKYGNMELSSDRTTLSFLMNLSGGLHRIDFYVDVKDAICETNETDNHLAKDYFVRSYHYQITFAKQIFIHSGEVANSSLLIYNDGNWRDNYSIYLNTSCKKIIINPSRFVLSLKPSEERIINFTLATDLSAEVGNYSLNVSVRTSSGLRGNYNITIRILPYLNFTLSYSQVEYLLPGNDKWIEVFINNKGNCNDTYHIEIVENSTIPVILENSTLNVSKEGSGAFYIRVIVPNGTRAFSKYLILGRVRSLSSNIVLNFTIALIVLPSHRAFIQVVNSTEYMGMHYYTIRVINMGNIGDLYTLNVSGVLANDTLLDSYSLFLSPGEGENINVSVLISPLYPAGSYSLSIEVYTASMMLASISLSVDVSAKPSFEAQVESSGGSVIVLEIKNTGNCKDSIVVAPRIEGRNTTWIIRTGGVNFTNSTNVVLGINQSAILKIFPKKGLPNGEYKVIIVLASSYGNVKNITVSLKIGEESGGMWKTIQDNLIYIVIGIIATVAVVLYLLRRE